MNASTYPEVRSSAPINVIGYGACLITGYPVPEEAGFLRLAVTRAAAELDAEIKLSIVSITSGTATKAGPGLVDNVLPLHPDIVVFQFGQSDVKIGARRLWREVLGQQRFSKSSVLVTEDPLQFHSRVKSFVLGCAGLAVGARPFSSRSDYRESIAQLVELTVSSGAYPIVFTPFVFDNFVSDAWARCYSRDLADDFAGRADVCIIDGWEPLAPYPRRTTLLHDGIHLSRLAHEILADRLKPELVKGIRICSAGARNAVTA